MPSLCNIEMIHSTKTWWYIFVNVFVFIAGVVCCLITEHWRNSKDPHIMGFFCNDDSIRYPLKESTIDFMTFLCGGLIFNLAMIVLFQCVPLCTKKRQKRHSDASELLIHREQNRSEDIRESQNAAYRMLWQSVVFTNGINWSCAMVGYLKLSTGRLRPHFLDVCQLDESFYSYDNCSGFITDYNCTQSDLALLRNARSSFPSGHSQLAFYYATFFVFYLEYHLSSRQWAVARQSLQFLAVTLATLVCISRVTCFMHHPSDIVCGSLLGIIFGFYAAYLTKSKSAAGTMPPKRKKKELPYEMDPVDSELE